MARTLVTLYQEDEYACVSWTLPADEDLYVVQYEALADGSMVHHMILQGCIAGPLQTLPNTTVTKQCYNHCSNGGTLMFAWARNAPPTRLPPDVGFHIGKGTATLVLVLQIHYRYASPVNEVDDISGLRVTLTHQRQPYNAGVFIMLTGNLIIPAHTKSLFEVTEVHGDISCQYTAPATLYPFAFRPHTHTLGRVVTGYLVQNRHWHLMGKGNPQWPQAFYKMNESLVIKTGDYLVARCTFDASDSDVDTRIGSTHNDEMCNFYAMYYTSGDTSFGGCFSNDKPELFQNIPSDSDTPLPPNPFLDEMAHHHHPGGGEAEPSVLPMPFMVSTLPPHHHHEENMATTSDSNEGKYLSNSRHKSRIDSKIVRANNTETSRAGLSKNSDQAVTGEVDRNMRADLSVMRIHDRVYEGRDDDRADRFYDSYVPGSKDVKDGDTDLVKELGLAKYLQDRYSTTPISGKGVRNANAGIDGLGAYRSDTGKPTATHVDGSEYEDKLSTLGENKLPLHGGTTKRFNYAGVYGGLEGTVKRQYSLNQEEGRESVHDRAGRENSEDIEGREGDRDTAAQETTTGKDGQNDLPDIEGREGTDMVGQESSVDGEGRKRAEDRDGMEGARHRTGPVVSPDRKNAEEEDREHRWEREEKYGYLDKSMKKGNSDRTAGYFMPSLDQQLAYDDNGYEDKTDEYDNLASNGKITSDYRTPYNQRLANGAKMSSKGEMVSDTNTQGGNNPSSLTSSPNIMSLDRDAVHEIQNKSLDGYQADDMPTLNLSLPSTFSTVTPKAAGNQTLSAVIPNVGMGIGSGTVRLVVVSDWPAKHPITLGQISGVAVDSMGNVHIFHRGSTVWDGSSFDGSHKFSQISAGSIKEKTLIEFSNDTGLVVNEWADNLFYMPHGLHIDWTANDTFWVTDVAMHQVMCFTRGSRNASLVLGQRFVPGSDSHHFCKPTDVATTATEVFVADGYCNSRIIKFSKQGHYIMEWGQNSYNIIDGFPALGTFNIPHSLTVLSDSDELCLADRENARVQCFKLNGNVSTGRQIVLQSFAPKLFAISYCNRYGFLYAVAGPDKSSGQPAIARGSTVDPKTGLLINTFIPLPTGFAYAHDIAVSRDGQSVYVVEIGPNRLWKFRSTYAANHQSVKKAGVEHPLSSADSDSLAIDGAGSDAALLDSEVSQLSHAASDPSSWIVSIVIGSLVVIPVIVLVTTIICLRRQRQGKSNCLGGGGRGGFEDRKNRRFGPSTLLGPRHPGAGFSLLNNGDNGGYVVAGNGLSSHSDAVASQELKPLNSEDDESDTEEFVKPFHHERT